MSTVKITSEQRRYLRERIQALFSNANNILSDRAIARRTEVTLSIINGSAIQAGKKKAESLAQEWDAMQKRHLEEETKLHEKADELNRQFITVSGFNIIESSRYNSNFRVCALNYATGTPLGRVIDEEMKHTPEGAQMEELRALTTEMEDRLMLDFEGKSGSDILTSVQESINTIVNRAKALPPSPSGKTPEKKKGSK